MQCTHVKADGIRCGSPALRGEAFCYFHFHNADHRARRDAKAVDIPFPEDAQCVQVGLYNVMQAVIERKIDEKRARLLIWSLQVAAAQTRTLRFDSCIHQSGRVTELPEYERVQRETAKEDREFIAKWQADAAKRAAENDEASAVEGGENPHPPLREGWGTQGAGEVVEDCNTQAGDGAEGGDNPTLASRTRGAQGASGSEGTETDTGGTGHSPFAIQANVPKQANTATAAGVFTEANVPTRAPAMSREQIDNLIDRACNGDWRSAKKLFREAGLMTAS